MTQDSEIKKRQLDTLKERQKKAAEMGGEERVARQKESGKLNARERIDALLDKGTFRETGMFARSRGSVADIAADGVITGYGKIDGRRVYIYSQDFTSTGGTL
ncbi:MAG: carboxyl transferase domain-containing protein, partial [Chloroflexota bacterium]